MALGKSLGFRYVALDLAGYRSGSLNESLVQLGQRVFQDVRDTVEAITDHTRTLRGTLRLAGGMTVCLYVFPPLLKHLKRVHPQLDLRLTVATAGRSVEEIRGGRVDLGLLTLPVDESDLITVPVLREELLLTKAELARKAGVSPLTVSRIESGLDCRVDTKRKIIIALGFTPHDRRKVFGSGRARSRSL